MWRQHGSLSQQDDGVPHQVAADTSRSSSDGSDTTSFPTMSASFATSQTSSTNNTMWTPSTHNHDYVDVTTADSEKIRLPQVSCHALSEENSVTCRRAPQIRKRDEPAGETRSVEVPAQHTAGDGSCHHAVLEGGSDRRVAQLADASTQELEAALLLRRERSKSQAVVGESDLKKPRMSGLPGFGNQEPLWFDLTKEDLEMDEEDPGTRPSKSSHLDELAHSRAGPFDCEEPPSELTLGSLPGCRQCSAASL